MKRIAIVVGFVILATGIGMGQVFAADGNSSIVTGKITGTRQPLPGYFARNLYLANLAIPVLDVEFSGFRLIREADGKVVRFRPNSSGYFFREVMPGRYLLARERRDRPDYRGNKTLNILSFQVEPGSLVNLGTLDIAVLGKPKEMLFGTSSSMEGRYTYQYGYKRSGADGTYSDPLSWFQSRKKNLAGRYENRIVKIQATPTREVDSSRVVLREPRNIGM